MVFNRRNSQIRPVNSRKNIVQSVALIAAAGTDTISIAITAETMPALSATNQVVAGSRINTVYIECWLYGNAVEGVNSPITWYIAKNPANDITLPDPAVAGGDDAKKYIFAMGKGLVGSSLNGQPGYLIRGWFSIPKRYRRVGFNDRLVLVIKNDTANNVNRCFMSIYKWYF